MAALDDLSNLEGELVKATYTAAMDSLERNEEMGERRLQALLTVVSAAGVAVGLVAEEAEPSTALWTGAAVSAAVAVLGLLTVLRLAKRNVSTTRLIRRLRRVRREVATEEGRLRYLFVYDPYQHDPRSDRRHDWLPTGGLVDVAVLTTAILVGAAVALAGLALWDEARVVAAAAVAAAVLVWVGQGALVRRYYGKELAVDDSAASRPADHPTEGRPADHPTEGRPADRPTEGRPADRPTGGRPADRPAETFRANVGVVVQRDDGMVVVIERADLPGAWQFPQGGIEPGEEPRDAALRELTEETGLRAADVEIVAELPEWLAYELPPEHRSAKTGRGQVQRWFLARLAPGAAPGAGSDEAATVGWKRFDDVLAGAVEFRRPVYERVGREFGLTP